MMRLALVIFKKDLRRLWWEAGVGIAVLAALTFLDAQRYDFVPGPTESMLNFLAPAVWAYLIAMLVNQEALVGDRQFWLTRPYPRTALLAAKVLGAVTLIHLPALVSDCIILSAHSFPPLHYVPQLAWKQAVAAGVLTLPALALAAVTRNLPQFAFAATLAALAGALVLGAVEPYSAPWIRTDPMRRMAAMAVVCAGAAAVVAIQYAVRRTWLGRTVGAAAAVAAVLLFLYMPEGGSQDRPGKRAPAERGRITVALAGRGGPSSVPERPGQLIRQVSIPIEISVVPSDPSLWFDQIRFRITTAAGDSWDMSYRVTPPGLMGFVRRDFQVIAVPSRIYERIAHQPLTIDGRLAAVVMESTTTMLPVRSDPVTIAEVGRCMSGMADPGLLRVMCESPETTPAARVVLRRASSEIAGRQQTLGDSAPYVRYPLNPWLSPLNRRQTFFQIRSGGAAVPGDEWLVPSDALPGARIELQSFREVRRIVSDYRLGPLKLADYLPEHNRGSMNLR